MITKIRCNYHYSQAADPEAKRLVEEFAEFAIRTGTIFFDHSIDDPAVQRFLSRIGDFGLSLWREKHRKRELSSEVPCHIYRVYDDEDLKSASLLELITPYRDDLPGGYNPNDETLWISLANLPSERAILGAHTRPCCPDQVKALLETAKLSRITFALGKRRPYVTDVGYLPEGWAPHEEKWWAIGSEVLMPPVGPPLIKFDHTFENRVERGYAGASNFHEDGFDDYELHYPKAEVDAIGEFDVALMYEGRPNASLIVSHRFWKCCIAHDIQCEFKPVRLDG